MNKESQRFALAKICPAIKFKMDCIWVWTDEKGNDHTCVNLDPLQDLNALHEAEKMLISKNDGRWGTYVFHLGNICHETKDRPASPRLHATAAQRVESILKTAGWWEEN